MMPLCQCFARRVKHRPKRSPMKQWLQTEWCLLAFSRSLQFLLRRRDELRGFRRLRVINLLGDCRRMLRMHDDTLDPMQQFQRTFVSCQWLHRLTPTPIGDGVCGGHACKRICGLSQHDCGKHVNCAFGPASCQRPNVLQRWSPETFADDPMSDGKR